MKAIKARKLGRLILIVLCLGVFAGSCLAGSLRVKALLAEATKYLGRQIQVEGRVEKWIQEGEPGKPGWFLLKDDFGDQVPVRINGAMPTVGARMNVTGLLVLEADGKKYFLQSFEATPSNNPAAGPVSLGSSGSDRTETIPFYQSPNFKRKVSMAVAVTAAMLLCIIAVAVKVKKSRSRILEIPEYSFDDIQTVYIDTDGKFAQPADANEQTRLMLPGYYEITKGPADLEGNKFYLATHLTRIGRNESGADKSNGWISFPVHLSTISRYQADLVFRDGAYFLEHKSKTNSTMVNGVALAPEQPVQLADRDRISFGGIELTYMAPQ